MNIVDYLGGTEGVEVLIETAWSEIHQNGNVPDDGFLRWGVDFETMADDIPLTDIRVPNYYRERNQRRVPLIGAFIKVKIPSGGRRLEQLFKYRAKTSQLFLDTRHDPLLLKIAESTVTKLAQKVEVVRTDSGPRWEYDLPAQKRSYTDGVVEPDASLSAKVKWNLEQEFMRVTNLRYDGGLRDTLRYWIGENSNRQIAIDKSVRAEFTGENRKLWFAAMRLLKPFVANTKPKHPELALDTMPLDADWWGLVKHFSNNYDTPLGRAIWLACDATHLKPTLVQVRAARLSQEAQRESASVQA